MAAEDARAWQSESETGAGRPTVFGRAASAEQAETAVRVSRRALWYAAEAVPSKTAEGELVAAAGADPAVLRLAQDYLGFTRFPLLASSQASALFMVAHARDGVEHPPSDHPLARAWRRFWYG